MSVEDGILDDEPVTPLLVLLIEPLLQLPAPTLTGEVDCCGWGRAEKSGWSFPSLKVLPTFLPAELESRHVPEKQQKSTLAQGFLRYIHFVIKTILEKWTIISSKHVDIS